MTTYKDIYESPDNWGETCYIEAGKESARKVMLSAGFRTEIKTGRLYGHPDKTRRLPVVLCHRLPHVTYQPYVR